MPDSHPGLGLRGRRTELAALDGLLAEARAGQGRVLVLRGEAGAGKTALLDYLQEEASGFRVARAVGVESEMELAFAGLHQLCTPTPEAGEGAVTRCGSERHSTQHANPPNTIDAIHEKSTPLVAREIGP
jgi:AAA ATPase-like protein